MLVRQEVRSMICALVPETGDRADRMSALHEGPLKSWGACFNEQVFLTLSTSDGIPTHASGD